MKVYTRTGDKGKTSLYGGKRVSKSSVRVAAYGTTDELNSCVGVVIAHVDDRELAGQLRDIQRDLFTIGSRLAGATRGLRKLDKKTVQLEQHIDAMDEQLPPLANFTLAGGVRSASFAGLARSICRRAERLLVILSNKEPVDHDIMQYVNRLSDYLFVLARLLNHRAGVSDIIWKADQ